MESGTVRSSKETTSRRMAILSRLALLLVVALALIVSLAPAPGLAEPTEPKTVRVGYYENEVFQEGAEEGAVKTGYAYEYYRKLSEYTGWKYEYVYGDFSDLYQQLLDGDIDLLAGLAKRDDRTSIIGYPSAPMGNEVYTLVKHDADTDITSSPESMDGKTIGVLDGAMVDTLNKYLSTNHVDATVKKFGDYTELFEAFDSQEIDVLAAEGDGAYGREHAEVIAQFGTSDYYLCVSIGRTDLLDELNEAQTQLQADEPNYLSSLRTKYYPHSVSSQAFTPAEKEWLDTHDTLRIGYLNHYLPYSDTAGNGEPTGVVKDLVEAICENLGLEDIEVTYTGFNSYDEMVAALADDQVDAVFPVGGGLYYSEENGIYQSNPVASSATELIYKGEYTEDTTKLFAVNENNRMQYYFVKSTFPDAEIVLYPSIDDCLKAVLSGEASCTTLNGLRAFNMLKNNKYEGLTLRQLSQSDDRCFGVLIGNEGLLKLLNRGVNVVGPDYATNLASRYSEQLYVYTPLDFISDNLMPILIVIIGIATAIVLLVLRDARRTKQQMAEREVAQRKLEEKNKELTESQAALSDALTAAENANHAKTAFLNNMSHDIRTPMNAIVGFTALAASHPDDKELVQDYLGKISVSSQHLLALINDVLDMSRIESGKMVLEESDTSLPDLIHDLRTIIQGSINAKQLTLFIDTQDVEHEYIVVDKLRLNQVLLNILTNAVKFTPSGGTIGIRIIEKPSNKAGYAHFEFRVKDNGIGMSEEFQKTLFDAFTRERTSTVSGIQGTGLGMTITKNIVDMMGGTIVVDSVEGEGTEFIVDIRCRIGEGGTDGTPLPEVQGLRALVVDDDTNACLSVSGMLRNIGMRPDWTNYGKEAVVRAKEALDQGDPFNTYIIDWMIPDLNGIETTRQIRKVIGDEAPIIILTAYDWSEIEEEAREAGVTAFCSKPIFMSELRELLKRQYLLTEANEEPTDKAASNFKDKRVLLVEDNALNQQIAVTILEEAGLSVDVANDGVEAVEMMEGSEAGRYDLILMDIQMPRMDGYEACRRIRALDDEAKANIPIIATTANAFDEDRQNVLDAGMNGHLAKPYDIPKMLDTLSDILK